MQLWFVSESCAAASTLAHLGVHVHGKKEGLMKERLLSKHARFHMAIWHLMRGPWSGYARTRY